LARDLGRFEHQWGANAASPVLFKSAILLHAGPGNRAMLLALRKSDGQTIWETSLPDAVSADPKEFKGSWSTPVLRDNAGQTELIVAHPRRLTGYDPITGKELWRCEGLSDLCYADPLVSGGYAVSMSGYGGPTLGMKLPSPGQTGNLTASHRLWVADRNPQRIGSGVMIGDLVYLCNEPGAMECIEAATGRSRWKERLGKNTWASAVYAGGLIYVTDQSATTFVIEPSPDRLIKVAENTIGSAEFTNSTPAFADGAIFLRTHSALYRIGN
jgi:outer membrane protein assembly factor BamB